MKTKKLLGPALFCFAPGCAAQPACTDSGAGGLLIPLAIVDSIASFQTAGEARCEVTPRPGDCDSGGCNERNGIKSRIFLVHAARQGACTVTVNFTGGCPSKTVEYTFGGPLYNCCEAPCMTSGSTELSATCD